ncbi:phosphatase PAP2 family protein [Chryseobacterium sp. PTM-20240506]|uniref:phosphatase PAP2 family protein n=2 Tax=Chryseobacterium TaxID=59732 RepID=UPI0023584B1B|nr:MULTISPECIES: phosphatase PAP2 family protein [unclassified Chryseobacterium]MDC8103717.1 ABC transporter permease [Chryseobacterium sp. B21-037]MDQ1803325.1 ABC transporter permease [Chryseobacterium sp. CKR4-1]
MEEKQTSALHKISRIISEFFSPLVSLFLFFVYKSVHEYSLKDSVTYFLPILLIIIIPIIIWLIWNVKTGRYTNMDVSNRVQRKTFYIFAAIAVIAYLLFHYIKYGSLDFLMLFILILLFSLQISNFFIKSSMHTAFNVFVAGLFYAISWKMGLLWLGIAVLVGITRVILKRHTIKEVFMGAAIAFLISFLYLYCSIHFQH